jgi:type IV pilus assembly protein PilA
VKQCPNCQGNLADYVPECPYCGVKVLVASVDSARPAWVGPQQKSGKATASLICGLVFFFWPLTALAAVILGHLALSEIKKSAGRLAGQGMALAGLVLGYIGLAFVPVILIIAAIAIPNLLRARMAANEATAVSTLRIYNTAMTTYAAACPDIGYPKELSNLGPGNSNAGRCAQADLVEKQLAAQVPIKYGYRFNYLGQRDSGGLITKYVLAADPIAPGTSGVRHFFTDESGIIRVSTVGGADANSEPLQ